MGEEPRPSWRESGVEQHARFEFLLRLHRIDRGDPGTVVHALDLGCGMGLSSVETFAVVEFLASRGYVEYLGAGPRVRIAPKGIRYIEWDASDRRTIRD